MSLRRAICIPLFIIAVLAAVFICRVAGPDSGHVGTTAADIFRPQFPAASQARAVLDRSHEQAGLVEPPRGEVEPASSNPSTAIPESRFSRFDDWTERYIRATALEKSRLEAEGVELARERRAKMADTIQADPKKALELAVPFAVRQELPGSVISQLERPLSRRGTLAVLAALPAAGQEGVVPSVWRMAESGDQMFRAFVYGRRLGEPTRQNIPIHGVALDDLLAVHEDSARQLDLTEVRVRSMSLETSVDPVCRVCGEPVAASGETTLVEVGEELVPLCQPGHVAALQNHLAAAESSGADGNISFDSPAASARTEGTKQVIIIRVDFSDLAGDPFSDATAENLVKGVDAFYREMSYGKTGFDLIGAGSDVTSTFRMPQTAAYYGARDASVLRKDARAAATSAGYTLSDYGFDLICFGAVPGFKFAGLGYIGAAGAWIRDSSSVGVVVHELGHNFGLNHANFWDTAGQSVIGTGTTVEYGDKFDTMGSANAGSKHFNVRYKNFLNWLTSADVSDATQSGTYRIFAHDSEEARGIRALRVTKNSGTNYWIEYRANYAGNKWLVNGASVRWAGRGGEATHLLDLTPGSPAGKDDACLLIGRTFSDREAGIHITPISRSVAAPEWLEIVVNKGSFPNNRSPAVSLGTKSVSGSVDQDLLFTASTLDADGDSLAYFWDFGDGSFGSNDPNATHQWTSSGEYLVQCTVSDMKGGLASDSTVVRIGTPNTFRLAGHIFAEGVPLAGVRVSISSTRMTYTDSDGGFTLVGLGAGSYTLKALLDGYTFASPVFSNPVRLGPSRSDLDFFATPLGGLVTESLVAAGSVWQFLDDGSNQGTDWVKPEFDDSAWTEGPAPLGYGDDNEKTVVRFGSNSNSKHVTTYFRRMFTVENPGKFSNVTLGFRRDDGGIVYLNGREVFRSNMPSVGVTYNTLASTTTGSADEMTFFQMDINPSLLVSGGNVLAVEIHQVSRTSSDVVFDLELLAVASPVPSPPKLSWEIQNGAINFSWPAGSTQWMLYSTDHLGPGSTWTPVQTPTTFSGGKRSALIVPSEPGLFYRIGTVTSR